MDEFNTYTPPAPAPRPVSHAGPLAAGIGIFLLGVAVGGGAMWYRNRPIGVTPRPSPGASRSPQVSASVSPVATNLPTITFKQTRQPKCQHPQQDISGTWDVLANGVTTGTRVQGLGCESDQPKLVGQGSGWAVIEIPFTGLGGYILYGEHLNVQYANFTTKTVVPLTGGATDVAFSPDGHTMAYLKATVVSGVSQQNIWLLTLEQGAEEAINVSQFTAGGVNAQVGAFVFSPDSTKLAFAVGYGPDPERGEIYVVDMKTLKFTKVHDTPIPPQELFWKADGTVGW